jgi:hypothetical protein
MADFDRLHRECLSQLPVSVMHTAFVIRPVKPWVGYALG